MCSSITKNRVTEIYQNMTNSSKKDLRDRAISSVPATSCPQRDDARAPGLAPEDQTVPENTYQLRIFRSLRQIIRAIELHSRKLDTCHQITGPQLVCLTALKEDSSLSVKKMAQIACLSPSTIVGIVDRLEDKGLVRRVRSTLDRRSVTITATEKGRQFLASTPSPVQESLEMALQKLPELEQVAIALAFEKVVDLMKLEPPETNSRPSNLGGNANSSDVY